MASGTFYPAASSDDGYWHSVSFQSDWLFFGNETGEGVVIAHLFVRFPNVTIPVGATITSAYVRFTASSNKSGTTCNANVYFNDEDDATAPTTVEQAEALGLTDAVAWNSIAAWTDGTTYDTPSLVSILQDIIDRVGWGSGQAVMVVIKDNSSSSNANREASDYYYDSGSEKPELHVEWVTGVEVSATCASLTVTSNVATISYDISVLATCASLTITPSIAYINTTLIEGACASLTITPNNCTVLVVYEKSVEETVVIGESLGWQWDMSIAESLAISETVRGQRCWGTEETVIICESLDWQWNMTAAESLDITDTVLEQRGWRIKEYLEATETLSSLWSGVETIEEALKAYVLPVCGFNLSIAESIKTSESWVEQLSAKIKESLVASETLSSQWSGTVTIAEALAAYTLLRFGYNVTSAEGLTATDAVTEQLVLKIKEILTATDTLTSLWAGTATIEEVLTIYEALKAAYLKTAAESLTATDAAKEQLTLKLKDALVMTSVLSSLWSGTITVEETAKAWGAVLICSAFNETASESLKVTDTSTFVHRMISTVAEALSASETLSNMVVGNPLVTEALGIVAAVTAVRTMYFTNAETLDATDTLTWQWQDTVAESIEGTDAVTLAFYAALALTESLELTATVANTLLVDETLAEAVGIIETLTLLQRLNLTVEENITASISVLFDDEVWECWVLTSNRFNPSVYSGFSFNSYAVYSDRAYGCKDDGIYELTGSTDAGTAIKSGIVLPETYFGSMNKKRFRKGYFGLSSSGTPSIRLETDSGNATYTITDSRANFSRSQYGRQWTVKLQSFDTVDFMELVPVILTR